MSIPAPLLRGLRLPVVAAPMFLVSSPKLVIAACSAGIIGTVPALNQQTTQGLQEWIEEIERSLGPEDAIFGVNLIVGKSNPRLAADLEVVVRHKVPLVITSFGADHSVVDRVHAYGGIVFHDVATPRHIEISAASGVDGLILLTRGAGGHCGGLNPFSILHEARSRFHGTLMLAGALATGQDIAAAQMAGADFAYMGTRFIATQEASVQQEYKEQIVRANATDVITTKGLTSAPASFLVESVQALGLDPAALLNADSPQLQSPTGEPLRPWRQIWSAGEGVSAIYDIPNCRALVDRLIREYHFAQCAFAAARSPFVSTTDIA